VVEPSVQEVEVTKSDRTDPFICPKCHAPMVIIELLVGINYPRAPPEKIMKSIERIVLKKMTG
jgi:hypothetical protein